MPRKPKSYQGRVHLGQQRYHWLGRYRTIKERDDAVALAKVERPWEQADPGDTVDALAGRMLNRMRSGALQTNSGRPYKRSSVQTAETQLQRAAARLRQPRPRHHHPA